MLIPANDTALRSGKRLRFGRFGRLGRGARPAGNGINPDAKGKVNQFQY